MPAQQSIHMTLEPQQENRGQLGLRSETLSEKNRNKGEKKNCSGDTAQLVGCLVSVRHA